MLPITKSIFGYIQNKEIALFTLKNINGHIIEIINYGGIIHRWMSPDHKGNIGNILLGCETIEDYQERHPYFGAIVGRYANRITYGKFSIDDHEYQLETNLPPHHLHGGNVGLDQKIWEAEIINSTPIPTLKLTTLSPDMEGGYPGNLSISVTYSLDNDNNFAIDYHATSDKCTPVNLTNHCYFDLSCGQEKTILNHELMLLSSQVLESDEQLIPTGSFIDIASTVLDYRSLTPISLNFDVSHPLLLHQKGLDHCFLIPNHNFNYAIATLISPTSGRRLQVYTTEPSIQVYTGNWLGNVKYSGGVLKDYQGICLETQHYPDSPNHPHFPSTLLNPNEHFHSKTIYKVDSIEN